LLAVFRNVESRQQEPVLLWGSLFVFIGKDSVPKMTQLSELGSAALDALDEVAEQLSGPVADEWIEEVLEPVHQMESSLIFSCPEQMLDRHYRNASCRNHR
jgi:hypothetical protein